MKDLVNLVVVDQICESVRAEKKLVLRVCPSTNKIKGQVITDANRPEY